ncbi:hypothetical protein L4D08_23655 [Photobacterium chitinilyticum]|uniref:hypothetical protein n=1 Tax=Photobacterium chitinilyticum TaxID=2485123 RepID=UPI003D1041C7
MDKLHNASELRQQARKLASECTDFAKQLMKEGELEDVIGEIFNLSCANKELIHIHVFYQPHVDEFLVQVCAADNSYKADESVILYHDSVYLNRNRFEDDTPPLVQLLEIEDKLLELIAEAKDKAEVAA